MKRGLYRNRLDKELHVVAPAGMHMKVLSDDIWIAEAHDDLFGTTVYVVTAHSLADAGYELIKEATS